jgi:hypothetical protein
VNVAKLGSLHTLVGPNYLDVIIVPEIASHIRSVVSTMTAQDVYAKLRSEIERNMVKRVRDEIDLEFTVGGPHVLLVFIEDILLRDITLPPLVASAIEEKIRQFHMVDEWRFRKTREEIEAERKKIEGRGIRNFQDEAGKSLTDAYLRLRGIEALLKLAESPNAKTIIIGGGPQGVPIILGNEGVLPAPGARPGPRAADSTTPPRPGDSRVGHAPEAPSPSETSAGAAKTSEVKPEPPGILGGLLGRLSKLMGR